MPTPTPTLPATATLEWVESMCDAWSLMARFRLAHGGASCCMGTVSRDARLRHWRWTAGGRDGLAGSVEEACGRVWACVAGSAAA